MTKTGNNAKPFIRAIKAFHEIMSLSLDNKPVKLVEDILYKEHESWFSFLRELESLAKDGVLSFTFNEYKNKDTYEENVDVQDGYSAEINMTVTPEQFRQIKKLIKSIDGSNYTDFERNVGDNSFYLSFNDRTENPNGISYVDDNVEINGEGTNIHIKLSVVEHKIVPNYNSYLRDKGYNLNGYTGDFYYCMHEKVEDEGMDPEVAMGLCERLYG